MVTNRYRTVDADSRTGLNLATGVYESVVMENKDALHMGRLAVYIPELGGNVDDPQSWKTVRYASPFYGITPYRDTELSPAGTVSQSQQAGSVSAADFRKVEGSGLAGAVDNLKNSGASGNAQQMITSYGMWAVPPDLGVTVLVMFAGGDLNRGFWFACVPTVSHGMVPAIGAPDGKTPMSEFNPIDPQVPVTEDLTSIERQPYQPLVDSLTAQGLQEDPIRGPITSSSFREAPSNVFGISSKSGHSFVMDDGSAEGTSKLVRLRTAGGNQITMHDDTGIIYLINASGSGWLEISPSGQIDVYGKAGINLATEGDINLHANNNVSIHAGNCVKIVGTKGTKIQGDEELQLHGKKTMIEGVDSLHVHSCKEMMITSYGDIHMKAFNYFCLKGKCFYWNSCTAKEAEQVPPEKPEKVSGYDTTVARAPAHEPYKEHDGGQQAPPAAPAGADGSASATGPGGMFGGGATAIPGVGGMDTAATSLGNQFTLNGLGVNTRMDTAATSLGNSSGFDLGKNSMTKPKNSISNPTGSSMGMNFNQSSPVTSGNTAVDYTAVNNANGAKLQNAAKTSATTQTGITTQTNTTSTYTAPTEFGGYSGIPATSQPGSLEMTQTQNVTGGQGVAPTTATTKKTLTADNAKQGQDVFNSSNPADQAMTGNSPAQDASSALDQVMGQSPSTDLPAAAGGGNTDCFAQGDNCERPADQTGGGGGGPGGAGDPNAGAAQTNYAANDPEGKAAAEAYLGRPMSDSEYNSLVAATNAEAGTNQTEQAYVSGTILNRARQSGQTVNQVLNQRGQFESVTGPGGPSSNFTNGPSASRAASINGSMKNILPSVPKNNYYFDAANPAAYKYGKMPTNRGGVAPTRIGASRFYPGASWN